MRIRRLSQFFLLVVFTQSLYSQRSEIGFSLGYGTSDVSSHNEFLHLYGSNLHYFDIGVGYYYTPKESIISFTPGIHYSIRGNSETRFHYFRIPMGFGVTIGEKRTNFILGSGVYMSAIISDYGMSSDSDYNNTKSTFQLGWYGNIGLSVKINEHYSVEVLFQGNADLTKTSESNRSSPGGSHYTLENYGKDGMIRVGVKYTLN